ncbi:hypothetical protein [Streptomyces sp. NPDC001500]
MSQSWEIEARSYTPLSTASNESPPLSATAREALDAGTADSTRRAYTADWQNFTAWCAATTPPAPRRT